MTTRLINISCFFTATVRSLKKKNGVGRDVGCELSFSRYLYNG